MIFYQRFWSGTIDFNTQNYSQMKIFNLHLKSDEIIQIDLSSGLSSLLGYLSDDSLIIFQNGKTIKDFDFNSASQIKDLFLIKHPDSICSSRLFKVHNDGIYQSGFHIPGFEEFRICEFCSQFFDNDLLQPYLGENLVTPNSFSCNAHLARDIGLGLPMEEGNVDNEEDNSNDERVDLRSEKGKALKSYFYRKCLLQRTPLESAMDDSTLLSRRLESGLQTVNRFYDPERQRRCREVLRNQSPLISHYIRGFMERDFDNSELENHLTTTINNHDLDELPSNEESPRMKLKNSFEEKGSVELIVKGLLKWFKNDFFSWVGNRIECPTCNATNGKKSAKQTGNMVQAELEDEIRYEGSRVELYQCEDCNQIVRFPRYNDPAKLLETRKGRCGEWANAFCFILTSLDFTNRYILDTTDHVWGEVMLEDGSRFAHFDSCENCWDEPLLYEQGWGKKLQYILGFGKDHLVDVTPKYTLNFLQCQEEDGDKDRVVIQRRDMAGEGTLKHTILPNVFTFDFYFGKFTFHFVF